MRTRRSDAKNVTKNRDGSTQKCPLDEAVERKALLYTKRHGEPPSSDLKRRWWLDAADLGAAFDYFEEIGVQSNGSVVQLVRYGLPDKRRGLLSFHRDPPPRNTMIVGTDEVTYVFHSVARGSWWKEWATLYVFSVTLQAGDILIMPAEFNQFWRHAVVRCGSGRSVFSVQFTHTTPNTFLDSLIGGLTTWHTPAGHKPLTKAQVQAYRDSRKGRV